jgi:hypothetical protein
MPVSSRLMNSSDQTIRWARISSGGDGLSSLN